MKTTQKMKSALRLIVAFVILGLLLLLPAGTFDFLEAWVYMVIS